MKLNETDCRILKAFLEKRILEYQQDLCTEGLSHQQYDMLRGRIKELTELISDLKN